MKLQALNQRFSLYALIAGIVFLLLCLVPARADGILQKGDTTHPIPAFQVQTPNGVLVNGDALTMHFLQGTTNLTGTGTFAQSTDPAQQGAEVFTFSAADMSGLAYGYVLCQPVDTTTPSNIINPYLVNLVAINPYDASLLGLTGIATAATQTTNGATLAGISTGVNSLTARPAQTGDTFGLLNPLITSGKLTAAALSNVPASTLVLPTDFLSPSEQSQLGTAAANTPAAVVTALLTKPLGTTGITVGTLFVGLAATDLKIGSITNTWNASTHTLDTAYTFSSGTVITTHTQYGSLQITPPVGVQGITATVGTIPQP